MESNRHRWYTMTSNGKKKKVTNDKKKTTFAVNSLISGFQIPLWHFAKCLPYFAHFSKSCRSKIPHRWTLESTLHIICIPATNAPPSPGHLILFLFFLLDDSPHFFFAQPLAFYDAKTLFTDPKCAFCPSRSCMICGKFVGENRQ